MTTIILKLLMPLQSKEALNACLEHATLRPIYTVKEASVEIEGGRQHLLDLEPLFQDWRAALSNLQSASSVYPRMLVFDIILPAVASVDGEDQHWKIMWDHSPDPGVCVAASSISRLVRGLATVAYLRSGTVAKFELRGHEEYRSSIAPYTNRTTGYFSDVEEALLYLNGQGVRADEVVP